METKKVDPEGSSVINTQVESEEMFFNSLIGDKEMTPEIIVCIMDSEQVFRYYDFLVEKQRKLEDGSLVVPDPDYLSNLLYDGILYLEDYPGMQEHKDEVAAQEEDDKIKRAEIDRTVANLERKQWNRRHPVLKLVKNPTVSDFLRRVIK